MKKKVTYRTLTVLILLFVSLILGCQPQTAQPTEPLVTIPETLLFSEEVATCLRELHKTAMDEINADIIDLDNQIAKLDGKEAALIEMQSNIDYAIDYIGKELAQEEIKTDLYWYYESPDEELALLSNDYYEFIKFYMHWFGRTETMEWKLTKTDIVVRDRETNATGIPEMLKNTVNNTKEGLISKKNDNQYAQEEAEQILINVTAQDDTWEINEISKNVYSVSGYGLGYYENQLSMGEWYYYEDSKTIEARSSASIKLGDVITAKD